MLVWIDLETTGLSRTDDAILEVGIIVTTSDLVELGRWSAVLHVDRAELEDVDPTVDAMHLASGLWAECESSERTFARTMREATRWLEDWRLRHPAEAWHLAGSSVWFDRGFLAAQWPELLPGLHHRILDVSSLRLAAETCWGLPPRDRGTVAHRVIPDLEASIEELRHWRQVFGAGAAALCAATAGAWPCMNPSSRVDGAPETGLCAAHRDIHAASGLLAQGHQDRLLLAQVRGLLEVGPRSERPPVTVLEELRRARAVLEQVRQAPDGFDGAILPEWLEREVSAVLERAS